jgi:hypothetical protein
MSSYPKLNSDSCKFSYASFGKIIFKKSVSNFAQRCNLKSYSFLVLSLFPLVENRGNMCCTVSSTLLKKYLLSCKFYEYLLYFILYNTWFPSFLCTSVPAEAVRPHLLGCLTPADLAETENKYNTPVIIA